MIKGFGQARLREVALRAALIGLGAATLAACAGGPRAQLATAERQGRSPHADPLPSGAWRRDEVGVASWYGDRYQGRATASGERFDMGRATAAHPTLPLISLVEVTNLENGRTVRVRVNDRSPRHAGRVIDLSRAAAEQLGFVRQGLARVRLRYLGPAGRELAAAAPLASEAPERSLDLDAIAYGDLQQR